MSTLGRLAGLRLCSDALALRWVQLLYFAAAPVMLLVSLLAVSRHAATPGELVVGVLAAAAVALLLIVIGLVVPLGQRSAR